jgi:hypothetical protein
MRSNVGFYAARLLNESFADRAATLLSGWVELTRAQLGTANAS